MREISILLLLCVTLAMSHPQQLENKQTLDDLISQIFTQDNSGVNNNDNANQDQNSDQPGSPPTPVIVQGQGGDDHHQYEPTPSTHTTHDASYNPDPSSNQNVSSNQSILSIFLFLLNNFFFI